MYLQFINWTFGPCCFWYANQYTEYFGWKIHTTLMKDPLCYANHSYAGWKIHTTLMKENILCIDSRIKKNRIQSCILDERSIQHCYANHSSAAFCVLQIQNVSIRIIFTILYSESQNIYSESFIQCECANHSDNIFCVLQIQNIYKYKTYK